MIYIRIVVISDVHGNREAFVRVMDSLKNENIEGVALLGDLIDYGMHSNEVIEMIQSLKYPLLCNLRGNHEQAIITESYDRFSSKRGSACAMYTHSVLNENTWNYIKNIQNPWGMSEFMLEEKRCLAVHGSLEDNYWKSIFPGEDSPEYGKYDYVFSGHSHLPHYFEVFYPADNPKMRNKKKTVFINPGSVGQPRNLNPMAQYCILNTGTGQVDMRKVPYDIGKEQASYHGQVDDFYRERLESGV